MSVEQHVRTKFRECGGEQVTRDRVCAWLLAQPPALATTIANFLATTDRDTLDQIVHRDLTLY